MFNAEIGGQIAWLLPAALSCSSPASGSAAGAPRTDTGRAACIVWGSLAAGHRPDVLLHGRDLPPVLHGRAGARPIAALVGMGAAEAVGSAGTARWPRSRWPWRPPRPRSGRSCCCRAPPRYAWLRSSSWRSASRQRWGSSSLGRSTAAPSPWSSAAALLAGARRSGRLLRPTAPPPHTGSIVDAGSRGRCDRRSRRRVAGPGGTPAAHRPGAGWPTQGQAGGAPRAEGGAARVAAAAWAACSTPRPSTAVVAALSADADLHVGRRGDRLAERRRSPARHASCR